MFKYTVKRILYFFPTLIAISFLAFGLSKCTPGDPAIPPQLDSDSKAAFLNYEKAYQRRAESFGLIGSTFYFELTSKAYPDTLHKIIQKDKRENWKTLISHYGNWEQISNYKNAIQAIQIKLFEIPDSIGKESVKKIRKELNFLPILSKDKVITSRLNRILASYNNTPTLIAYLKKEMTALENSYQNIKEKSTPNQLYIPVIHWYGFENQYHNWITSFVVGDFGTSYKTLRPVASEIKDAVFWTVSLMILSIFVAFLTAIPLGVFSAKNRGLRFDKIITLVLFMLYSLPTFWIATMLVVFFTTPEYGAWTNIFPSIGLGDLSSDAPFWNRFWETASHLILPVFCISYSALAFISRQMRGGMIEVIQQDYIRTARAKGLNENQVIWKHAFRNSLFPIITLFANVFPAALAGSVVIEVIFNIPGMGKLTLASIFEQNYPVVFAILMLAAVMTMVGMLVADILYAMADPRISFDKK
ncbi:MAG: peptide/nickel transport system permease protein [Granulosicoccus sp.]|jgi:peptide/nickel transport system permease protein